MNETASEKLLDALVVRLNAVVPAGFGARAQDGWLLFGNGSAMDSGIGVASLLDQQGNVAELVMMVAEQVLSTVQDWIAVELTTPWPAEAHNLPEPGARIVGDVLELWYGDPERPSLRLDPIGLADVL